MKLLQVLKAREIISVIADKKIPAVTAYKFTKFLSQMQDEYSFFNERLAQIIDKYAERDADGKIISTNTGVSIKKEIQNECNSEINELNNCEVDAPSIKFRLKDLEDLQFSIQEMMILSEFIDE